jgi:hypothetical protein
MLHFPLLRTKSEYASVARYSIVIINFPKLIFFLMALAAHSGPWPLIQFRNHFFSQTVELLGRVICSLQGLCLNTGEHKHRINAYTHQTSMSQVEFEPTIPAFERAKTVQALGRAATVTGSISLSVCKDNFQPFISHRYFQNIQSSRILIRKIVYKDTAYQASSLRCFYFQKNIYNIANVCPKVYK